MSEAVRVAGRGAAAGAAAACAWAAAEPLVGRALRSRGFSDVRLLGRLVPGAGRHWRAAGVLVHAANGAAFGALFALAGGRGPRAGLAWAMAEAVATWPGMALIDRVHPDRRSGGWPPLATSPRVMAQEAAMHALFGLVLGLLVPAEPSSRGGRD